MHSDLFRPHTLCSGDLVSIHFDLQALKLKQNKTNTKVCQAGHVFLTVDKDNYRLVVAQLEMGTAAENNLVN